MQSEDFDKRIRDAADHHHPAYNEKAWSKMEQMLDTHLPVQKKDRRRGFILLLLGFVLLGGITTWLYVAKPWQPAPAVANSSTNTVPQKSIDKVEPGTLNKESIDATAKTANTDDVAGESKSNKTARNNSSIISNRGTLTTRDEFDLTAAVPPKAKRVKKQAAAPPADSDRYTVEEMSIAADVTAPPTAKKIEVNKEQSKQDPELKISSPDKMTTTEITSQTTPVTTTETLDKPADKVQEESNEKTKPTTKKASENGFAISVSAGPDISAVGTDDWGKVQPVYGVGVAYTFANRFTVRTGFYTASKIYTAKPDEYKNSPSFPNYNYLEKIDADCRVYEIPLTLAYSFGESKKHNWFASTGLSSYLMKRETYDYVYKYPNGSSYTHQSTYNNQNTNIFSVMSLSAGYTRKLSNKFSLSAEPYLKIPLSGVGEGSVQLNSVGIMFSINAKLK